MCISERRERVEGRYGKVKLSCLVAWEGLEEADIIKTPFLLKPHERPHTFQHWGVLN